MKSAKCGLNLCTKDSVPHTGRERETPFNFYFFKTVMETSQNNTFSVCDKYLTKYIKVQKKQRFLRSSHKCWKNL